jgi:hypothetical protein
MAPIWIAAPGGLKLTDAFQGRQCALDGTDDQDAREAGAIDRDGSGIIASEGEYCAEEMSWRFEVAPAF